MGLAFVLAMTLLDQSGIAHLVDHSTAQGATVLVFVGTIVTTFSVGATLTGLLLIMTEDS
jgi:NADH:ubiquinone oxidoreductase subunit 6 (subunit J)